MDEGPEGSTDHQIVEMPRRFEFRNPRGEPLIHAEVPCLPRDLLPQPDQAGGFPGDGSFTRALQGFDVEINVAGKVEARRRRCTNLSGDFEGGHDGLPNDPASAAARGQRDVRCKPMFGGTALELSMCAPAAIRAVSKDDRSTVVDVAPRLPHLLERRMTFWARDMAKSRVRFRNTGVQSLLE
jgi:hypothetical protein